MKELRCPHCGNVFTVDESDYAALLGQVKNAEFETELARRVHELEQNQQARAQAQQAADKAQQAADKAQMQLQLQNLQSQLQQAEQQKQIAVMQLRQQATEAYAKKEQELAALRAKMDADKKAAEEQIAYYKDLKIKLSTKMVGETLEQHCYNEFTRISPLFPHADFHKDNDSVIGDDGRATKGDFIFRDSSEDGVEYVSIMFEMKNENDETATKHKNQDFFAKLDQDRKKKNCEYAVLVSMLEPENDLYNDGIVTITQNDKGERFDKMYVIRPQFFVPLITLLCQTSRKSLEAKRELALVRAQQIDVTCFEERLKDYQTKFSKHVKDANARFQDAVKDIDEAIKNLMDIRDKLTKSTEHLEKAEGNLDDLTNIKRLTKGNPTMQALFAAAQNTNSPE